MSAVKLSKKDLDAQVYAYLAENGHKGAAEALNKSAPTAAGDSKKLTYKALLANKEAAVVTKRNRGDSSSDDEPVRPSAAKKVVAKKVVDSSSDDDVPVRPSAAKKSPMAKPKVAKKIVESSSSDEAPARPSAAKVAPKKVVAKKVVDSSSDDDVPVRPSA
eukprot:165009_1